MCETCEAFETGNTVKARYASQEDGSITVHCPDCGTEWFECDCGARWVGRESDRWCDCEEEE